MKRKEARLTSPCLKAGASRRALGVDINITERLVKSGRILDIPVLDHIIVGKNRFISLKERGVMA